MTKCPLSFVYLDRNPMASTLQHISTHLKCFWWSQLSSSLFTRLFHTNRRFCYFYRRCQPFPGVKSLPEPFRGLTSNTALFTNHCTIKEKLSNSEYVTRHRVIKMQPIISLAFYCCRCSTQLCRGLLRARFSLKKNKSIYTPALAKTPSEMTGDR